MSRMLSALSTRRYPTGLEPVGAAVTESATATAKSGVSHRFARDDRDGALPLELPYACSCSVRARQCASLSV